MDKERIKNAVKEILIAVGEDPTREGLVDTPERVAKMYMETCSGMIQDPREVTKSFESNSQGIVIVKDIAFSSTCEHHLLPFVGKATIAYIPGNNRVLGLSKLARVVDVVSSKLQIQERLCNEVASVIAEAISPNGVAVLLEAEHTCMTIRGVKKETALTKTIVYKGIFEEDLNRRNELLQLL